MIFEFFRCELRQQLRSPLLWLLAAMFGLFAFGAASTDAIQVGNAIGNVNRNAPTVIVSFLGVFSLLGLLIIVSFVSGALLRDFELGTADLFFSSPMRKRDFLIGRFGGALVACMVVYLMVVLGLLLAPLMPWIDPARLGPFSITPYIWGLTVLVLPNLFFTGALLALLAVTTRSLLTVYLVIRRSASRSSVGNALLPVFLVACIAKEGDEFSANEAADYFKYKQRWSDCYLAMHDIDVCNARAGHPIYPEPDATRLQQKLDWLEARRYSLFQNSDRTAGPR